MSSHGSSSVLFQAIPRGLKRAEVRAFAATLRARVTGGRSFDVLITRDAELERLNREFLNRHYPADVLSFPSGSEADTLGEIAISWDRAVEQAERFGHSVEQEIAILMLHGALHLCGMDHESDRGHMRRMESKWRAELGLPSGLIERTRR
jgi:probable rRNA maturation factor